MKEYRCTTCNKLLFKGLIVKASISIKCNKCKCTNEFKVNNENSPKKDPVYKWILGGNDIWNQ